MTELNNVCACAKLTFVLSLVRVDFSFDLFCSFDVLFVWFVPRYGP